MKGEGGSEEAEAGQEDKRLQESSVVAFCASVPPTFFSTELQRNLNSKSRKHDDNPSNY